jgi:hypothetical protein
MGIFIGAGIAQPWINAKSCSLFVSMMHSMTTFSSSVSCPANECRGWLAAA